MPEDYVCITMTSGDAHHIYRTGGDPGLDFLSHSDVDSQIEKMSRLGLMIQWPDKAGDLPLKYLLEGLPPWQRNRKLA